MNKFFTRLSGLISISLAAKSGAAVLMDEPHDTPLDPDTLKPADLNISVSKYLAAHRSHSSHASHSSHRSSSGGGYRSPSVPSTPAPTPKRAQPAPRQSDPLGQQPRPKSSYPSATPKGLSKKLKDKKARKNIIMRMQLALQFEGWYDGKVDGIMGPATRKAIEKYKRAKGIPGKTVLDVQTLNALGIKGF